MDEHLTNRQKKSVRLTLARRLQEFYATLKGYFSEDASAILQRAEDQASPRDRDNDWHRIRR